MTKFILHGGYTKLDNDLNKAFFREIVKDLSDTAKILLVYFAREDNEIPRLLERDKSIFLGTGRRNLDLVVASPKSFIQQIETADVIFLSGGETDKLLNALKQSPDFVKVIIGKIVVGSSAGAYALAKYYYSNSKDGALEGLGILPIKVACHYESKIHPISGNDPIAVLEEKGENLDIIALKDCEWKVLER